MRKTLKRIRAVLGLDLWSSSDIYYMGSCPLICGSFS